MQQYSVFVERFSGEIEEIEIRKKMKVKLFLKLKVGISPQITLVYNKQNTLFTEDVVHSSDSPYNKLGLITNANYTVNLGDTSLNTQTTLLSFTNLPVVGDKLFGSEGFIGKITSITQSGSNLVLNFISMVVVF